MFIAAIGIPTLIHQVQHVIGWGEGVVYDRKLVTKTSRSTPDSFVFTHTLSLYNFVISLVCTLSTINKKIHTEKCIYLVA